MEVAQIKKISRETTQFFNSFSFDSIECRTKNSALDCVKSEAAASASLLIGRNGVNIKQIENHYNVRISVEKRAKPKMNVRVNINSRVD